MTSTIKTENRVVYISPYYDPKQASGANRRFDEICKRFLRDLGDNFTLIVSKGNVPEWWNGENLFEVDYDFNHVSKFKAVKQIGDILDSLLPSNVIIESIPIPFRALKRHNHFQVAYDFRYFTGHSKSFLYRLIFSPYLKNQWGRSQFMVTPSDFSIDELKKYVGYDEKRVLKSYFGLNEKLFDSVDEAPLPKTIDVIYVAHFEKRKNHAALLEAIALTDKNMKVFFLGRDLGLKKTLEEQTQRLGLTNITFQTESCSDKELWDFYKKSKVFAYPSTYEGFGIPLIEALALGIPVICADTPVFHEVGSDLVTFFDPYDPKDISEKLKRALSDGSVPSQEKVRAHVEKFFWENIYKKFAQNVREYPEKMV